MQPTAEDPASTRHEHGQVTTTVVDDHVLVIQVDRVEKRNAMTPKIMAELSAALTRLDDDEQLWVGVLTFAGEHTTAGLEMPLFFAPGADTTWRDPSMVDPFGLGRRLSRPLITAVQGICFTVGIEIALAGLGVGAACGALNGALVTVLGLPSIVATIGTMSLFRGLAYAILGDGAYTAYPDGFAYFGQGYVWAWLSFEFVAFLAFAAVAGVVLHATTVGRAVRACGHNPLAARFSGLKVGRIKFRLFVVTGLAASLASVMLTSRLGSTRPSIAQGWELEIITMVVLGGVSINGGSGGIPGVVLAAFVMGLVTFGLGLLNVPGIIMSIFIGLMLIAVIALPVLIRRATILLRGTGR